MTQPGERKPLSAETKALLDPVKPGKRSDTPLSNRSIARLLVNEAKRCNLELEVRQGFLTVWHKLNGPAIVEALARVDPKWFVDHAMKMLPKQTNVDINLRQASDAAVDAEIKRRLAMAVDTREAPGAITPLTDEQATELVRSAEYNTDEALIRQLNRNLAEINTET